MKQKSRTVMRRLKSGFQHKERSIIKVVCRSSSIYLLHDYRTDNDVETGFSLCYSSPLRLLFVRFVVFNVLCLLSASSTLSVEISRIAGFQYL